MQNLLCIEWKAACLFNARLHVHSIDSLQAIAQWLYAFSRIPVCRNRGGLRQAALPISRHSLRPPMRTFVNRLNRFGDFRIPIPVA